MDIWDDAKAILHSRKQAYETVFSGEGIDVKMVLKDLAQFCRANQTTFSEDPRLHALLEGRREVWLRIQKYLNTTPDELWELTRKD
jgi:hypothetical protein